MSLVKRILELDVDIAALDYDRVRAMRDGDMETAIVRESQIAELRKERDALASALRQATQSFATKRRKK